MVTCSTYFFHLLWQLWLCGLMQISFRYNRVNNALLDYLTNQIKETDNSGVWRWFIFNIYWFSVSECSLLMFFCSRHLVGFKNILRSIECFGIASVHGINYFGRGLLSTDKYVDYIRYDILGKDLLNSTINYIPSVMKDYRKISNMVGYNNLKNW